MTQSCVGSGGGAAGAAGAAGTGRGGLGGLGATVPDLLRCRLDRSAEVSTVAFFGLPRGFLSLFIIYL